MVIADSAHGTRGARAILGETHAPRDFHTVNADSALDVAKSNTIETERGLDSDRAHYEQARGAYLAAARQLQNRVDRLGQRITELHALEAEAGLPETDTSAYDLTPPAPIEAGDYVEAAS